jgi:cell division protein FtsN
VKRSQVPFAVAGAIAGVAVLAWILRGGLFGPPKPASQPGAVREATRPVPADRASSRPPAPAAPAAATKPTTSSLDASSTGEFMIVVSSFKTRDRSNRVAADILALGMPAFVRTSSGWEQVVVGPYPSRQDALAAQAKLEAAHFADTKVTQGAP